ncbi:HEAT repeat domain-containing protein [Kitasatospora sp. NPDC097643]|uniref:HEAT repeat domain-containing protein n=1 Tax=Kitasatospora sp. NPDC097643 TaxID=3157230 RepID=UPI00331FEF63
MTTNRAQNVEVHGDLYQAGTIVQRAEQPPVTAESVAAACAAYARRVRETYGRLDLEVLTPLSEQGEHPVVELREVFVTPQVREDPPPVELPRELLQRLAATGESEGLPPGLRRATVDRLRAEYLSRPTEDVLTVLAGPRGERAVLLGDPGSGKSTLARYLALTLTHASTHTLTHASTHTDAHADPHARAHADAHADVTGPLAPLAGRLPLVVELRQYAEERWRGRTFEEFLDHLHHTTGMSVPGPELHRLLTEGRAVVIFDGLDELFDPGVRTATATGIAAFAARYDRVRTIVTSRVIGYQRGPLGAAGFTHLMLQDLDPGRIATFACRWYRIACPADPQLAARLVERITGAVAASRPIRELAGNPLLLTILAIIGRRQTLPRDRQGVYEHAVRVLVAHWDRDTKHLRPAVTASVAEALDLLDDRERLELLRLLARRMQEGTGGIAGNHIHADELEAVFRDYFGQFGLPVHQSLAAARALRDQLRERNFILARYGGEVYGFVHRAFLEHLAAADVVHRYTVRREWTPEELITGVFARRAGDPAWHEVLLLVVNQLSEPDAARAIDHLLDRHQLAPEEPDMLVLALRALAEVRKIGLLTAQSDRAVDGVVSFLTRLHSHPGNKPLLAALPALAGFGAGWSGRERYLRWYHLRGQFLPAAEEATSIACTLHHDVGRAVALARYALKSGTRAAAVSALADRWSTDPDVLPLLLQLVDDGVASVRYAVVEELASRWPEHPAVLPLLIRRTVQSSDGFLRTVTLNVLAQRWPNHPDVFAVLRDLAVHERDSLPRAAALTGLATYWHTHPEVLPLILERATADEASSVRAAALTQLGQRWQEHPPVLPLLRERAVADLAEYPREIALGVLVRRWPEREDVLTLAATLAIDGPATVRAAALRNLARYWLHHPQVLPLLLDRAVHDPADFPRQQALRQLAADLGEHPDVLALLRDRAVNDPSPNVRSTVLEQLARVRAARPPQPPVLPLLLDRAAADPDDSARGTAIRELADHWGELPDVIRLLQDRAAHDRGESTRRHALQALADRQPDDPSTVALLHRAATDPWSTRLRTIALNLLAEHAGRHPETVRFLLDRAATDPDHEVRCEALSGHAVLAADEDARAAVRARAATDPSPLVRRQALTMLAWQWPTHRETATALQRAADEDPEAREAAEAALRTVELLVD